MRSTQGAYDRCNRQVGLSLPGSGLLTFGAQARRGGGSGAGGSYAGAVLNGLRDERGRPNARVRLLAVLLALALGGPLTVFVVQVAADVVGALY